ncbi:8481_t:CDS:2, partial [Racocetra fulgida]
AGFTSAEIDILHNTTLRDIILRNTPAGTSLPQNLWFVQPRPDLNINNVTDGQNDGYSPLNVLLLSNVYKIKWKVINEDIYLKMTMLSDNAWFGIGFNSLDGGMVGTDFLIVNTINSSSVSAGNYHSDGYRPPIKDDNQFVQVISYNISKELTQVEVKRPLKVPGKLPIVNQLTKGRLRNEIPEEVYETLPLLTWKVSKYYNDIGTDISDVFFNDKDLEIKTDEYKDNESSSINKTYLDEENDDQNKKVARRKSSIKRKQTIADTVDRKLEKTESNEVKKDSINKDSILSSAMLSREAETFKRYVLVNKDDVAGIRAVNRVKKFIFQAVDPNDSIPKITPGDYIEIMCHIKGQVVIRCYNLFKLKSPKCFYIIIKIYNEGLMSSYLDMLLDGFEIKVRGPFRIGRRIEELNPRQSVSMKPIQPISLINTGSDDGCWDTLFMLCGGTGLSPMLQLYASITDKASITESPRGSIEIESTSVGETSAYANDITVHASKIEYMRALKADESGFKFVSCGPSEMLD